MAERADRYARNIAHGEAWAQVRLGDGCHIWRTTTGYLACFDGAVIVHAAQPIPARGALGLWTFDHPALDALATVPVTPIAYT